MEFTYPSGSRPLDGYTIKRALGRGGFGEVYYAVADSGKDVALKLVQRSLDVELRGVGECLNLKNPHLLQIFDVRRNDRDELFIIMEYVAGPSLRQRLAEHPQGLPAGEVRLWFDGMAQAVDCLHHHGVVHRDLNPSNVFLEEGVVKVGDYGLSKFISSSARQGHTQSVGTVHYMAPEVGSGQYGPAIDIYALGVILYEMWTGRVPFDGQSASEILMKHLTAPPPVDRLPEPCRGIVARALAKRPEDRFPSAGAMAAGLGIPSPPPGSASPSPPRATGPPPSARPRRLRLGWVGLGWGLLAWVLLWASPEWRQRPEHLLVPIGVGLGAMGLVAGRRWLQDRAARWAGQSPGLAEPAGPYSTADLVGALVLSAILAGIYTVFLVLGLCQATLEAAVVVGSTAVAGTWPTLLIAKLLAGQRRDQALRRVLSMTVGMAAGAWGWGLERWGWPAEGLPQWRLPELYRAFHLEFLSSSELANWLVYFGLAFLAVRFWAMADPRRPRRVVFGDLMAAGLWALGIGLCWPFPQPLGLLVVVVTALTVQTASPWVETSPQTHRRADGWYR